MNVYVEQDNLDDEELVNKDSSHHKEQEQQEQQEQEEQEEQEEHEQLELYNIKKELIKDIKTLSTNEHIQVFYIIQNANVKYTENNNGIFINLSNINNTILNKLIKFVEYAKINNTELETTNKIIDKIREENIKD